MDKPGMRIVLMVFAITVTVCSGLTIDKLDVPEVLVEGRSNDVILDCQYTLDDDTGLVVKWFFKNKKNLVYQWIKDRNPQVVGQFKNHVDLSYNASNVESQRYRAIKLLNPDASFSGEYTCVVSTYVEEATASKNMTIFSPGFGPIISYDRDPDDKERVRVTCEVPEIHPEPNISLSKDGAFLENQSISLIPTQDGKFNATVSVSIQTEDVYDGDIIQCKLRLPVIKDYEREVTTTYKSGSLTDEETIPTAQLAAVGDSTTLGAAMIHKINMCLLIIVGTFIYCRQSLENLA